MAPGHAGSLPCGPSPDSLSASPAPNLVFWRLIHMDSILGFQLVWPMGCIRGAWREGGERALGGFCRPGPNLSSVSSAAPSGAPLASRQTQDANSSRCYTLGARALPAAFPKAAQTSINNPITKLSSWPPLCVCCVFPAGPLNDRHGMGKHTARMHPQAGPE